MKRIFGRKLVLVFLLLLLSYPVIRLVFGPGFYSLHDDLHVGWLYEMDRAAIGGQFPPRWVPDLSFGYGYPLFNFVYPLPFYLGEVFHLLGLGFVGSVKAVFIFSILASALTMFLFLGSHFSVWFAFLGALFYVYTPYRAVEIFVRGAIGEALLFVFLPLVGFFIDRALLSDKKKYYLGLSASIAGLILTHNIGAMMALPFWFLYGIWKVFSYPEKRKKFFKLLLAFVFGSFLSAFFWLPAIVERKYMVADTLFNFRDHFPFIKQLIFPSWGYGISIWGPNDEMSFQIGIVNLLAAAFSLLIFFNFKKLKEKALFSWAWLGFIVTLFLMNIRSSFLWETVPLLPYFQFPWRFLMMTTFLTPIFFAQLENFWLLKKLFRKILALVLFFLAMILVLPYFRPEKVFPERTDDYFLRRYLPNRTLTGYRTQVSYQYLDNTEEYLRLPLWTQKRPSSLPKEKMEAQQGSLSFEEKKPTLWEGKVISQEGTSLFFHQYYFPGWRAWIDGKEVKITKNKPYGDMKIDFSGGEHQFKIEFRETNLRLVADGISLFSWLGLVWLLLLKKT